MKKTKVLRELLMQEELLVLPGASTALFGKLVELAGFKAVYATGAGIANMNFGVPDIGLITMTENLEICKRINDATALPVVADIDNGYGNAMSVYRTVREFTAAGIACIQLEDQQLPKRCGHFNGKAVIEKQEMVGKIKAAKDAMLDPETLLIARTDAIAVHGFEDAMERAAAYLEAGADILFVEAPTDVQDLAKVPKGIRAIHIANMVEGGKTPIIPNTTLAQMGFKIALYANAPMKAAIKGTQDLLQHLMQQGRTDNCEHLMISMKERNQITGLEAMTALDAKYKA